MYVYIIFCTVYRVILRTLYFSRLTEHSRDVKRTSRGYHIYRILEVLERPRERERQRKRDCTNNNSQVDSGHLLNVPEILEKRFGVEWLVDVTERPWVRLLKFSLGDCQVFIVGTTQRWKPQDRM